MDLHRLRSFVAVAEELHFGRGARRLGIAQPPLSQQIKQLEEALGVTLFDRNRRQVALTAAGQVLLNESLPLLRQVQLAERRTQRAHRGETGHLSIGFVGLAMNGPMPAIVRAFSDRCPDVELEFRQMTTTEQESGLGKGAIDAGFLRPPLNDRSLIVETLDRESLVVILSRDHRLAGGPAIQLAALAGEPFVLPPRALGSGLHDIIIRLCQEAGFRPLVAQEAVEMATIVGLVRAGMGISIVPASIGSLREAETVVWPLAGGSTFVELALARRDEAPSPVLRSFVIVAREVATTFSANRTVVGQTVGSSEGDRI